MSTISASLVLSSTTWHTDPLAINLSQTLTVDGDEQAIGRVAIDVVSAKLPVGTFDSANKKVWVYLKNLSTDATEIITLQEDNAGAAGEIFAELGSSEWMFFPYADNDFLWVVSAVGTPTLEFGVFEV